MANRNSSFGEGQSGAKGAETGIIKPAVERTALSGGYSTAKAPSAPVKPKVVEQDGTNIFNDNTVIDEREIASSKGAFVKAGGRTSDESRVPRIITTPTDRNASSHETLQKLTEHYQVMRTHSDTHLGDQTYVEPAKARQLPKLPDGTANPKYGRVSSRTLALQSSPEAMRAHDSATKNLSDAGKNLALAKDSFAVRQSAKGNGHLQSAASSLISAHASLNNRGVREITGAEVPIHKDELSSWKEHANKLPSFNRQGKPFPTVRVQMPNVKMSADGQLKPAEGSKSVEIDPSHPKVKELAKKLKGTNLGDKLERGRRGSPKTPKWERDLPGRPSQTEKMSAAGSGAKVRPNRGGEAVDTTTRGYTSGTTGENDPRRKADDSARVNVTLPKTNLPKIGDTTKPAKKPMKPGDKAKGK